MSAQLGWATAEVVAGWNDNVKSRTTTAPPGSPANRDVYIIPTGATGDWSGHAGKVTGWNAVSSTWEKITPPDGYATFVEDESVGILCEGGGYRPLIAKNNWDATVAPTVNNDVTEGYSIGSIWIDKTAKKSYILTDATDGAAVWKITTEDSDAIHASVSGEIKAVAEKVSPVGADVILIEDSADSDAKKRVQITNLPGGADADAIHDNVSAEISAVTEKTAPVAADLVLIEDSAASNAKKKVQVGNLGISGNQAVVQARRTTAYALTTSFADVTLDTTDEENDTNTLDHDLVTNTDRILIGDTGQYRISYHVDLPQPTTNNTQDVEGRIRVNDTTVLPGSEAKTTVFEDSSIAGNNMSNCVGKSFIADLTDGDYISLQLQRTEIGGSGAFSTEVGIIVTAIRLSGERGGVGPAGAGSAEVDVQSAASSSSTSTTSATYVDLATMTLTTSNTASKKYLIVFSCTFDVSVSNKIADFRVMVDDVADAASVRSLDVKSGNAKLSLASSCTSGLLATGKVIKIQYRVTGGTLTTYERNLSVLGVS